MSRAPATVIKSRHQCCGVRGDDSSGGRKSLGARTGRQFHFPRSVPTRIISWNKQPTEEQVKRIAALILVDENVATNILGNLLAWLQFLVSSSDELMCTMNIFVSRRTPWTKATYKGV